MRIGIDVSGLTARPTGVGHFLGAQLQAMMSLAPEHTWLGLSTGRGGDGAADFGLARHRHIPLPTRLLYRLWDKGLAPRADRLLGGVDLYHGTNYFLPPAGRAKRVLTIYDLSFLVCPDWASPRIVGPFQRGIRKYAHEADSILTCSEASRRDIIRLLDVPEDKVAVAYGGADPLFTPQDEKSSRELLRHNYGIEKPYFLFVSTLEPRKNVFGLLEAFADAAQHLPHELILVGGLGWKMEGFDARVSELGITHRVRRLGYIPDRRHLPHFYSAATALVLPSFYEGFGFPVLEAMACACPVITSPVSSLPEVGGEAVCYVEPGARKALADAMEQLAGDAARRADLAQRGPDQARSFTWEACARQTLGLYERLL